MTDPIYVTRTITINTSPSRVWDIVSSPAAWLDWMLVPPSVDPAQPLQLGSPVAWLDDAGTPYLTASVTRFDPASRLVLELADRDWQRPPRPGEVTYSLAMVKEGPGVRLDFALGNLAIDPAARQWQGAYANSRELEAIKQMAEAS